MNEPDAPPARTHIRIDYFVGIEETEAVHLGPYPHGSGELFRVARPSINVGGVAREDVVRLEPEGDHYVFWGVVERSAWERRGFLLPREISGMPDALAEFEQAIADAGCILDGEHVSEEGYGYVVSVPPGVTGDGLARAYERAVQRTVGLTVADFGARVGEAARQRNLEHHAREARKQIQWRRRQRRVEILRYVRNALIGASCVAVAGWWLFALVRATPVERPRIAALGMIIALSPTAIVFLAGRGFREPILTALAAAVGAFVAAGHPTAPDYRSISVALGLIFIVFAGPIAFLFGMFSGFASSEKDLKQIWIFLVLPSLASCVAAVVYIATALLAARSLA